MALQIHATAPFTTAFSTVEGEQPCSGGVEYAAAPCGGHHIASAAAAAAMPMKHPVGLSRVAVPSTWARTCRYLHNPFEDIIAGWHTSSRLRESPPSRRRAERASCQSFSPTSLAERRRTHSGDYIRMGRFGLPSAARWIGAAASLSFRGDQGVGRSARGTHLPRTHRPAVRPFQELEPIRYAVTVDMVTGIAEVDQKIERLAEIYTEIALYRKEVYELKSEVQDKDGVDQLLEPMNEIISSLRETAEKIRTEVRSVPAAPFEEPEAFTHDI